MNDIRGQRKVQTYLFGVCHGDVTLIEPAQVSLEEFPHAPHPLYIISSDFLSHF